MSVISDETVSTLVKAREELRRGDLTASELARVPSASELRLLLTDAERDSLRGKALAVLELQGYLRPELAIALAWLGIPEFQSGPGLEDLRARLEQRKPTAQEIAAGEIPLNRLRYFDYLGVAPLPPAEDLLALRDAVRARLSARQDVPAGILGLLARAETGDGWRERRNLLEESLPEVSWRALYSVFGKERLGSSSNDARTAWLERLPRMKQELSYGFRKSDERAGAAARNELFYGGSSSLIRAFEALDASDVSVEDTLTAAFFPTKARRFEILKNATAVVVRQSAAEAELAPEKGEQRLDFAVASVLASWLRELGLELAPIEEWTREIFEQEERVAAEPPPGAGGSPATRPRLGALAEEPGVGIASAAAPPAPDWRPELLTVDASPRPSVDVAQAVSTLAPPQQAELALDACEQALAGTLAAQEELPAELIAQARAVLAGDELAINLWMRLSDDKLGELGQQIWVAVGAGDTPDDLGQVAPIDGIKEALRAVIAASSPELYQQLLDDGDGELKRLGAPAAAGEAARFFVERSLRWSEQGAGQQIWLEQRLAPAASGLAEEGI